MRNLARLVLAEDDREHVYKHARFLNEVCGYEVTVIHKGKDLLRALENSGAAWLILDLELEDGFVDGEIPKLRQRFGQEVFIIILTGYYDRFSDTNLFQKGVNEVLHKPYRPEDMLIRLRRLEAGALHFAQGTERRVQVLRAPHLWVDLKNGRFERADQKGTLPDSLLRFLQLMAQREDGGWKPIDRADLMVILWGREVASHPAAYGERLRSLTYRVRSTLGEIILRHRIQNNSTAYVLAPEVQMEEEEA